MYLLRGLNKKSAINLIYSGLIILIVTPMGF